MALLQDRKATKYMVTLCTFVHECNDKILTSFDAVTYKAKLREFQKYPIINLLLYSKSFHH